MGVDDFYIYATSRTDDVTSENTSSMFTNILPKKYHMEGDNWYCALKEVHFPTEWLTLTADDAYFEVAVGNSVAHAEIDPGHYTSCEELCSKVSGALRRALEVDPRYTPTHNRISFQRDTRRSHFILDTGVALRMRAHLAAMMGFRPESTTIKAGVTFSPRAMDITGGIDNFYVYANFVTTRIVGNVDVPLLRIVPLKMYKGCRYMEYDQPSYMKVNTQELNSINILVVDSVARYIPFTMGETTMLLHFTRMNFD